MAIFAPNAGDSVFNTPPLIADLDTGSPVVVLPSEDVERTGGTALSTRWRQDRHLGRPYEWRPYAMAAAVVDERGQRVQATMTVLAVREWERSPFVRVKAKPDRSRP